jgi:signal transduction histidine kinase
MPRQILEELDLNAVISEAVALMQEESDTTVVVDLDEEPLVLRADREELRRIYINLIKNAFQAMPAPGNGQVRVATLRHPGTNGEAGWAYSTVSDTGTGIPLELRGKIFEPNFSTKTSGTGLGLAIIKQSVENLQGDIDFETEEGVGTTFRIRLPLVR